MDLMINIQPLFLMIFLKRLNPNNTGNKFDFELISVDVQCLCSEDKAIVFFLLRIVLCNRAAIELNVK